MKTIPRYPCGSNQVLYCGVVSYQIWRSYAPHLKMADALVKSNLTLKEAQAHCKDPSTREAGVWFDCYKQQGDGFISS